MTYEEAQVAFNQTENKYPTRANRVSLTRLMPNINTVKKK